MTHDRPARAPAAAARAFTLIELAIVITIMAVLAAIAVPRFAAASATRRLDVAAQRIAADLRHAQQHALASSAEIQVAFDAATETYVVAAPSPVTGATSYSVCVSDSPIHAGIHAVTFASSRAVFDAHGASLLSGTVTLRVGKFARDVSLTAGSPAITVGSAALGS